MLLQWKNETRPIGELKPYKYNPRTITEEKLKLLIDSVKDSGYNDVILVDTDNTIIAGHQRWHVLKHLGFEHVDVRVPERKLTEREFKRINIQDNINNGEWNNDILNLEFDHDDLIDWGLHSIEDVLDDDEDEEVNEPPPTKAKSVECPECGNEFVPE